MRAVLHGLRYTPLHPQWFAYRYERQRHEKVACFATGRVLDIGCGRKPLLGHLHDSCIYFSLDHPATGKKLYDARPNVFADAYMLPFADGAFDTVLLLEVLEHLSAPANAIHEACRVLAKGGRLIVTTPFLYPIHDAPGDYHRWTRPGLEHLIKSSGLDIKQWFTMGCPVECGVLLLNLSLAWQSLYAPVLLRLPLMFFSAIAIPLLNLLGTFFSVLYQRNLDDSPFAIGYLLVVKEPF